MPAALPIGDALERCAPLARLQSLLRDSQARFEVIGPELPAALMAQVKPGPVNDEGWTLLASNTAVAAKLRQLLPRLESILRSRGYQSIAIRIRVQPK